MKRIGLTGGIGSGKSTVASVFATLGIPCYDSDRRAKELMVEKESLRTFLFQHFGPEVIQHDRLQTEIISKVVFGHPELLEKLNGAIHPEVGKDFDAWCEKQTSPYVLKEAALLFESGSWKNLDEVVCVTAPEELRIQRVMQRNGFTREQVIARINNQWPEAEKTKRAQYVIENDGNHSLIEQVLAIHQTLLKKVN
jgi:dephospho-CoA kinase